MNKTALIGYSGYVGTTLLKQTKFDCLYRSTNIQDIRGKHFDYVVCAGAPAQKWIANKSPDEDKQKIDALIEHLRTIKCEKFILISTVDVFKNPVGVNENSLVDEHDLHAYGLHRRQLEKFVTEHFQSSLIVRLPGLVGPGLRKNIIYDLLHKNNLKLIDSRAKFQFYPMVNLWFDIQKAITHEIKLVHLTAEPVSVREIAEQCFSMDFTQEVVESPASYDMQTIYANVFGSAVAYQYTSRETVLAVRAYAQSESLVINHN